MSSSRSLVHGNLSIQPEHGMNEFIRHLQRVRLDKTFTCPICHNYHSPTIIGPCQHVFGYSCIFRWVQSTNPGHNHCPMCRRVLFACDRMLCQHGTVAVPHFPDEETDAEFTRNRLLQTQRALQAGANESPQPRQSSSYSETYMVLPELPFRPDIPPPNDYAISPPTSYTGNASNAPHPAANQIVLYRPDQTQTPTRTEQYLLSQQQPPPPPPHELFVYPPLDLNTAQSTNFLVVPHGSIQPPPSGGVMGQWPYQFPRGLRFIFDAMTEIEIIDIAQRIVRKRLEVGRLRRIRHIEPLRMASSEEYNVESVRRILRPRSGNTGN